MLRPILFFSSLLLMSAGGTISIAFNAAFAGGVSESFADSSGTVRDDMVYGIVIDSDGDGFLAIYDSGFSLTQGSLITLTEDQGTATDDQLLVSVGVNDYLTRDNSGFKEGDQLTTGGPGGIGGVTSIPDSAAGKDFAIIWFDFGQAIDTTVSDGVQFGLLTDASFVMGSPGFLHTYDTPFVGVDPVRPANFGTFTVIPEPSTTLLLGVLGSIGLVRRRR